MAVPCTRPCQRTRSYCFDAPPDSTRSSGPMLSRFPGASASRRGARSRSPLVPRPDHIAVQNRPDDLVHWRECFGTTVWLRAPNVAARLTPAITHVIFALCSAACKALRFASTAHARGLRALTRPPRSARIGYCVMTLACDATKYLRTWIDLASPRRYSRLGPPLTVLLARRSTRARAHRILPLGPIRFTSRFA